MSGMLVIYLYHLYSRPIWVNDLKNKTSNITDDEGVIYTGNPKILKKYALVFLVQLSQLVIV